MRDGDKHTVVEYIVRVLLEGDIETSYTQADNSVVVATDSSESIDRPLHDRALTGIDSEEYVLW